MHTFLIEGNPVGTVLILYNILIGELVLQVSPFQQESGIRRHVNDIGTGSNSMEHACSTQLKRSRLSSREIRFFAHRQRSPELPGKSRIEHIEGASNSRCSG